LRGGQTNNTKNAKDKTCKSRIFSN